MPPQSPSGAGAHIQTGRTVSLTHKPGFMKLQRARWEVHPSLVFRVFLQTNFSAHMLSACEVKLQARLIDNTAVYSRHTGMQALSSDLRYGEYE